MNANGLPDFLIIGAQKCGTSWLFEHLAAHPDLYLPPEKELEFFSYAPHLENPGLDGYRQAFTSAQGRLAGEATASYFWTWSESPWCNMPDGFQHDIPGTVREYLGSDTRFLLCLRNPVERAISAWAHYLVHGELSPEIPFRKAAEYGGIIDMGFYGRHLQQWQQVFPEEQFCLVSLEDQIGRDPGGTLNRCFEFLNVGTISFSDETLEQRVFPGAPRQNTEDETVIELPQEGKAVTLTGEDREWLTGLYETDQLLLRSLTKCN